MQAALGPGSVPRPPMRVGPTDAGVRGCSLTDRGPLDRGPHDRGPTNQGPTAGARSGPRANAWPVNAANPRLTRQALADDLMHWSAAAGVPCEHRLAERLAAVIAAIVPDLDPARQALLARYSLWTILLDDRLDDPGADPSTLRALTGRLGGIARAATVPDTGDEPLAGLLVELLGAFRRFGDTARMVEALRDAMAAAIEQATRDPAVLPGLADYLAVASRDINYRSFAHALVLLVGGARPAAVPPAAMAGAIDAALVPGARAVRLANDLRTVDRDLTAGRLNVLSLRHPGGGAVRVATVVRQIAEDVRHHDALLGAVPDPVVAGALRNSLHVAIGLYRSGDLR